MLATAVFVLVAALFFATRPVRGEVRYVTAILPRADGIREGTVVTYLGVEVGMVERLRLDDGRVVVDLRIHRDDATMRRGDTLRARTLGPIGDKALDWIPGPRTSPFLGPGDTIVAVQVPEIPPDALLEALRGIARPADTARARPGAPPR